MGCAELFATAMHRAGHSKRGGITTESDRHDNEDQVFSAGLVGTWQEGIGSMKSADWFCMKAPPSRRESGKPRNAIHPGRWGEVEETSDQNFFVRIDCPLAGGPITAIGTAVVIDQKRARRLRRLPAS